MTTLTGDAALASLTRVTALARETMFIPEAAKGNDNTLWQTMEGGIFMLSRRYAMSDLPVAYFAIEIQGIWDMFALASQHIDADHMAQDRLVRIVLQAREHGVLERTVGGVEETAVTAQGRIWTDLPFLVENMREAWKGLMAETEPGSMAKRINLTAGIARLAAVGVCGSSLGQCGLEVMKLALERPEGMGNRSMMALVKVWLRYAGHQLLLMSLADTPADGSWRIDMREATADDAGMSRDRFVTWKDKLDELKAQATDEMGVEVDCAYNIKVIWDSYFGLR